MISLGNFITDRLVGLIGALSQITENLKIIIWRDIFLGDLMTVFFGRFPF